MLTDKPQGQRIGWLCLDSDYPFSYHMFRIRRDRVRLPSGVETDYAYMETKGAVWVVPVTDDGRIILIKQYRYAVDDWTWEVPAGGKHDHTGSDEELARRELSEEVGATCRSLEKVGWFYGAVSTNTSRCEVFLARGAQLGGASHREPGEIIEVHPVSKDAALAMARNGEIKDGKSALALLMCEAYLKEESQE
jgi:ADP-ribose pyrophosphatase